jgi:DNA-binding NarL/FixJ family response regulator
MAMTLGKIGPLPERAGGRAIWFGPALAGPINVGGPPGGRGRRPASQDRLTERPAPANEPTSAGVLIADPEMLVRAGLRAVIDGDRSLHVAAEAETGAHALELIGRLRPPLAVISTGLREPAGIDVARLARASSPATAIVLLARADDTDSLVEGFRVGVTGFVRSDVGRLELLTSLTRALAGESVIDPAAATALILRMAAESELPARTMPDPLTPRELEILQLVAQGQTNRQIATRLIVAVGTIKIHVEHIIGKLGAADRTQAAVRAAQLGIVHVDEREERVRLS